MKYIVTGRVHPERADISFSRIQLKLPGDGTATASCDASQITVLLEIPSLDGWISAIIAADDIANIIIGSLGFSLGSGYSVELIQVTEEDGTPHVFGVRPEGKKAGETLAVEPHIEVFNHALRLASQNIFFRPALRDYLQAITDVTDCATYCYRAIESIKAAFVQKTGNNRWDDMHAALGTDQNVITSTIKDYADPIRHGNCVSARSTDKFKRWDMLELTRNILVKYLDHEEAAT